MCGTLTIEAKAEEEKDMRKTIDEVLSQHLRRSIRVSFGPREEVFHYAKGIFYCKHASVSVEREGTGVHISICTDGFDRGTYSKHGKDVYEEQRILQEIQEAMKRLPGSKAQIKPQTY